MYGHHCGFGTIKLRSSKSYRNDLKSATYAAVKSGPSQFSRSANKLQSASVRPVSGFGSIRRWQNGRNSWTWSSTASHLSQPLSVARSQASISDCRTYVPAENSSCTSRHCGVVPMMRGAISWLNSDRSSLIVRVERQVELMTTSTAGRARSTSSSSGNLWKSRSGHN